MKMRAFLIPLAFAALAAGCQTAKPSAEAAKPLILIKSDATIAFANRPSTITNWSRRPDGSLLLEANGRFYHLTLRPPCSSALSANNLGFKADPTGEFTKLSSVTTGTQECPVDTLDEVANPNMPAGS